MSDTPDSHKPADEEKQSPASAKAPSNAPSKPEVKAPSKPVKPPVKPGVSRPAPAKPEGRPEAKPAAKPAAPSASKPVSVSSPARGKAPAPKDESPSAAMLVVDGLAAAVAITFTILILRDVMPFL